MSKYITKKEFEEFKKDVEKMLSDIREVGFKHEYEEIDAKSLGEIFGLELYKHCVRCCIESMPDSGPKEMFAAITSDCYEMFNEIGFVSCSVDGNRLILSVLNSRALLEDCIQYFQRIQEAVKEKYDMTLCASYFSECNEEENIHSYMKKAIEAKLINLSKTV